MEKTLSPKSPLIYEKYKSGCAWCLIGLCDFSQGHTNKEPISNRGRSNSTNVVGKYCQYDLRIVRTFICVVDRGVIGTGSSYLWIIVTLGIGHRFVYKAFC